MGAVHDLGFDPLAFDTQSASSVAAITLNGVDLHVRKAGLTIRDVLNDAPNTCTLVCDGPVPQVSQALRVELNAGALVLFAGSIQTVDRSYEGGKPALGAWPVSAIDDTARANSRRPFGTWVSTSATTIGESISADFAPDFTTDIEAGLPDVSITFDGSETFIAALVRLANLFGGYAKVEDGVIYLFLEDLTDSPDPIDVDHPPLNEPPIRVTTDVSQLRTRVYGKGYGENVPSDIEAGEDILPLVNGTLFPLGGQAITGVTPDGAQSQIIEYTGVMLGAGGTLVGPGAAPPSAPVVVLAAGSGVETGDHDYAYVFETAAGKTLPSPLATIAVGFVPVPTSAATAGTPTTGGSMNAGSHRYYAVFRTAAGSTTAGPVSNAVTAIAAQSDPSGGGSAGYGNHPDEGNLVLGESYQWIYTFRRISDGAETLPSGTYPGGEVVFSTARHGAINVSGISVPGGYELAWYRSNDAGSTYGRVTIFTYDTAAGPLHFRDGSATGTLGGSPPVANTTAKGTCAVTSIPVSPEPLVTHVDMYREFNAAGAGTAKLAFSVTNGTTSASDSLANSGLGATVPGSNTAAANRVSVTYPAGPTGTIDIELFRTTAGGSQLKFFHSVGSNTAGTTTDSTADASLGANAPSSDTSGLTQPPGQVNAGSTTLLLASTGPFDAGGGWVKLGSEWVRYTGISGQSLTGIPASGPGSILTTVLYGDAALPSPALTGVTGIVTPMLKGSAVHIWVQRDDLDAQAAQAARDGGDGIVEYLFSDGRRGEASLIERCDAELALFSQPIVTAYYATRDVKTKSGKQVVINLPSPLINETLTIQEVTIDQIDIAPNLPPRFTVTASSVRFSLEDMLRRLVAA